MYFHEATACSTTSLPSSVYSQTSAIQNVLAPMQPPAQAFRLPYTTTSELAYSIDRRAPSPCMSYSDVPRRRGHSVAPALHRTPSISNLIKRSPSIRSKPLPGQSETFVDTAVYGATPPPPAVPASSSSPPRHNNKGEDESQKRPSIKHARTTSTPNARVQSLVKAARIARPSTSTSKEGSRNWSRPTTPTCVGLPLSVSASVSDARMALFADENERGPKVEDIREELLCSEAMTPFPEKQRSLVSRIAQRWRRSDRQGERDALTAGTGTLSQAIARREHVSSSPVDVQTWRAALLQPSPSPSEELVAPVYPPLLENALREKSPGLSPRPRRRELSASKAGPMTYLDLEVEGHSDTVEEFLELSSPVYARARERSSPSTSHEDEWDQKNTIQWPQHFYRKPKSPLQHSFAHCLATSGWTVTGD